MFIYCALQIDRNCNFMIHSYNQVMAPNKVKTYLRITSESGASIGYLRVYRVYVWLILSRRNVASCLWRRRRYLYGSNNCAIVFIASLIKKLQTLTVEGKVIKRLKRLYRRVDSCTSRQRVACCKYRHHLSLFGNCAEAIRSPVMNQD